MSMLQNENLEVYERKVKDKVVSRGVRTLNPLPSLTKQSEAEKVEINSIMSRYERTGVIDYINVHKPIFDDVSDIEDYRTNLHKMMNAQEAFLKLPSKIRKYFSNDPLEMLNALHDSTRERELQELGLIEMPMPEKPLITDDNPSENEADQ